MISIHVVRKTGRFIHPPSTSSGVFLQDHSSVYCVFFPWTCRAIAYSATGNEVFDLNVDPAANESAGIGNDTTLQTCASSGMAGAIVAVPNDNQVSWKRRYV